MRHAVFQDQTNWKRIIYCLQFWIGSSRVILSHTILFDPTFRVEISQVVEKEREQKEKQVLVQREKRSTDDEQL